MKIVHASDPHIFAATVAGSNPVVRFQACLDHIEAHNRDADFIVLTGDLVHFGGESAYTRLRQILDASQLEVHLMIGGHDDRETFQRVFSDVPRDENGFVQYTVDKAGHRAICLDTKENGSQTGQLCEKRIAWLNNELETARFDEMPVLLFLHHHPVNVGVWSADVAGLGDPEHFGEILKTNSDVIRHVFFGHCHYTLSGSLHGIPFSAPRSTCYPCWPEFSGKWALGIGPLVPNYNVALVSKNSVIVHSIDFMLEGKITYIAAGEEASRIGTT